MYCQACGTPNDDNNFKCIQCGGVLPRAELAGPQPGQTVDTPLSKNEYLIYTIAFLFIPCVNVLVSSILYYIWRAKQPNRANQMNRLGFMVFGAQLLLGILLRLAGLS
ncbi:MAG: hypothetical protein CO108_22270 [Deltaproteobacteria bacterium CG_4_9_14_3_um_filter_63_12]|nr:MAG: hypothetical protein CO108_22270 [Deltaproteobacteria bacterium CG_4_9_14_3_um_filter_63_12]